MIDGTYAFEANTPLGNKKGTLEVHVEGERVIGILNAPIVGKKRFEGRADGDTFTAEGTIKLMLLGKIDYSVRGQGEGDKLRIAIESSKGNFNLTGTRI